MDSERPDPGPFGTPWVPLQIGSFWVFLARSSPRPGRYDATVAATSAPSELPRITDVVQESDATEAAQGLLFLGWLVASDSGCFAGAERLLGATPGGLLFGLVRRFNGVLGLLAVAALLSTVKHSSPAA